MQIGFIRKIFIIILVKEVRRYFYFGVKRNTFNFRLLKNEENQFFSIWKFHKSRNTLLPSVSLIDERERWSLRGRL